jgi:glucose-6-phosphate isomerase
VTLVRPAERTETAPVPEPDATSLSYLEGVELGGLLDAEFAATEASLAAAGRPNVRIEVDRLDAEGLGALLYGCEAACVLAGELADAETFTQPAVEWGKRAARALLRGEETAETRAIEDKTTLLVD